MHRVSLHRQVLLASTESCVKNESTVIETETVISGKSFANAFLYIGKKLHTENQTTVHLNFVHNKTPQNISCVIHANISATTIVVGS